MLTYGSVATLLQDTSFVSSGKFWALCSRVLRLCPSYLLKDGGVAKNTISAPYVQSYPNKSKILCIAKMFRRYTDSLKFEKTSTSLPGYYRQRWCPSNTTMFEHFCLEHSQMLFCM